jgi:hypothetical protein
VTVEHESGAGRSRAFANLVFGAGGAIAGTVYGTVVAMATLTAAYASEKHPWKLAVIVASTALVLWLAHLHAHGLSESITEGRKLTRTDVRAVARRELGILLAAAGPVAALILGAVGLLGDTAAVWLAFGIGLGILAAEGLRYGRLERAGLGGTLLAMSINLALGLAVVGLKVALAH